MGAILQRRESAAIFAGGCAGALARAGLADALPAHAGQWPWATLAANLAGALLLGGVVAWSEAGAARPPAALPFLGPGLCGALTTFSTLQVELLRMLDAGRWGLAAAYAAVSLAGGIAAVTVGGALLRRVGAP